jgi:hypothetical protein
VSNKPYSPLEKENLGRSIAEALLRLVPKSLSQTAELMGAGVYAIYYIGDFEPYAPIKAGNVDGQWSRPIYVGKAIPKGGRKGGLGADSSLGRALRDRLTQHAETVRQAENLRIEDFHFRALVVEDIWIPLGENVLIERFKPVWNWAIDGFGNKDPGGNRMQQKRSPWDVLHPGRRFAINLGATAVTREELEEKLLRFFAAQLREQLLAPPKDAV